MGHSNLSQPVSPNTIFDSIAMLLDTRNGGKVGKKRETDGIGSILCKRRVSVVSSLSLDDDWLNESPMHRYLPR